MRRSIAFSALLFVLAALLGASQAHAAEFHSEVNSATITGAQVGTDIFTTSSGTVECEEITTKGAQATTFSESLSLTPAFTGCSAQTGFSSATIASNGCTYNFRADKELSSTTSEGTTDIVCPEGKELTITATLFGTSKCTIKVPAQNLGTVEYHEEGSGATRDVKVVFDLTAIKYAQTAGTGFGACSSGSFENGTYEGEHTVKAEEGSTQKGLWVG
jgi:hypothetical protein